MGFTIDILLRFGDNLYSIALIARGIFMKSYYLIFGILFLTISCDSVMKKTSLEEESKSVIIVDKLNASDALALKEAGKVDCQIETNESYLVSEIDSTRSPQEGCENILRNKAQKMGAEVIVLKGEIEKNPRCAYTPILKTEYSHCIRMNGVAYKRK